jgi:hypothetical protein
LQAIRRSWRCGAVQDHLWSAHGQGAQKLVLQIGQNVVHWMLPEAVQEDEWLCATRVQQWVEVPVMTRAHGWLL